MQKIVVNGKEYPCYETCGASLRFKQETGRDVSEMLDSADIVTFLYCKTKSACVREHIDFDMSLQDFADNVLVEDFLPGLLADVEAKKK